MKAPFLEENKCSVIIADYATGHVLKKDLTPFLNGNNEKDTYYQFENFYEAQNFVLNSLKTKPEFECSIFNHNGEHLTTYDIKGERK